MAEKPEPDGSDRRRDSSARNLHDEANEEFASEPDFKAWAHCGTRPEEILVSENRKRYEAYLAKHGIKL